MSQNQLFEATVKATGKKVRVYQLSNSSKQAGKYCDYDQMSDTYTADELNIGKAIKTPA